MMAMVHPDSWFIIVNPVSGGGRARRYAPGLRAALDRRRLPYACAATTSASDASHLVARALRDGHRRLLALGGDGSFHELVNALFSQARVPPAHCLVAAAAQGTGNDWARTMQVPDDPVRLAACMARGRGRGGGMRLAGDAALDDGWLDLVTVEPESPARAIAALPKLFDGRLAGDSAFRVRRCRSVTIDADPRCGVELDGQPCGETPVTLTVDPGALQALDCRDSAE